MKTTKLSKSNLSLVLTTFGLCLAFLNLLSCGAQAPNPAPAPSQNYVFHPLNRVSPVKRSELTPMVASRSYYTLHNLKRDLESFFPQNRAKFGGDANSDFDFLPVRFKGFGQVEHRDRSHWREGELITEVEVAKPSGVALVFEAVNTIVLTTQEGEEFVFDSDDFDENLKGPLLVDYVFLKSNNPRSINSDFFRSTLRKARKLSVVAREGYWSDVNGEKTQYRFNIRDTYHSFLSSLLTDAKIRHRYGGSVELDQKFLPDSNSLFNPESDFFNLYIFDLYDVNYRAFFDIEGLTPQKPIETLKINGKDTEVLSVYLNEGVEPRGQMELFFFEQFLDSFFVSQPSEFIKHQVETNGERSVGEGIARTVGYYWYGKNLNESLFAAAYIPVSQEKVGSLLTTKFRKNPNFWDQEFVKNPNTINDITVDYERLDSTKHAEAVSANFIQGQSVFVRLRTLPPSDIDKILTNTHPQIPRERVAYRKAKNFRSISGHQLFLTSPSPLTVKDSTKTEGGDQAPDLNLYSFNDVFSVFMYGAPREVLARGEAKTLKAFFGEDQVSFRSLLLASVNWVAEVDQRSNHSNEYTYSLTLAPRDGKFNGSDQQTSKFQTISSDLETANTPFVVLEGRRGFEVPYSANLEGAKALTIAESLMGGGKAIYQRLQEEMTKLLDRVWAKNGFGDQDRLEFTITFFATAYSETAAKIIERVVETINNLDLKGRLALKFQKFYERKLLFEFLNTGRNFRRRLGWISDWEGAGGYVAGFLANGYKNFFFLGFLAELAKREEEDTTNPFPYLTRLAKLFKEAVEEGRLKFKVPFQEWMELTNRDTHNVTSSLTSSETYFNVEVSRFFLEAQERFTNQEWLKLYIELSVLLGPKWDSLSYHWNPLQGERWLLQKGLHFPATHPHGLPFQDFYFDPIVD